MKILINSSKNLNFYKLYYDNNKENIPLNNNNNNKDFKNKLLNSKELKKNFGKNISNHLTTLINNNNKNYSLVIQNKNNVLKINNFNSKNVNNILKIKDKNINKNSENKKTNKKNSLILIYNDNNNNNNDLTNENKIFPEKEYFFDIFEHLLSIESDFLPKFDYMNLIQNDINENMRNILLEWLFELHIKFKLRQETFLLTINIIDRYLSIKKINRNKLQLLGIASMFISCKIEEIYIPKLNDFIYFTDFAYKINEMIEMEFDILNSLDFNINFASSLSFLNMFKNLYFKINENMNSFCCFLINLSAVEYKMINFKSSHIAIGIIFISYLQFNQNINEFYLNHKFKLKNEIFESIKNIIKSWKKIDDNKFQVIKRKYMSDKYYKIGKEKINFDLNYLL